MFYFNGYTRKHFLILRLSLAFNLVESIFVNRNFKMASDSYRVSKIQKHLLDLLIVHGNIQKKSVLVYHDVIEWIDCITKAIPGMSYLRIIFI